MFYLPGIWISGPRLCSISITYIRVGLLEDAGVCYLEVDQQVAAGALDVPTVTLQGQSFTGAWSLQSLPAGWSPLDSSTY